MWCSFKKESSRRLLHGEKCPESLFQQVCWAKSTASLGEQNAKLLQSIRASKRRSNLLYILQHMFKRYNLLWEILNKYLHTYKSHDNHQPRSSSCTTTPLYHKSFSTFNPLLYYWPLPYPQYFWNWCSLTLPTPVAFLVKTHVAAPTLLPWPCQLLVEPSTRPACW